MCWNADISINTFMFSVVSLCFIYFANTLTKYKTKIFENPLVYLFLFEVSFIQLIEYFLWKNLNNKKINETLSIMSLLLLITQPLTIIFMINILPIRNWFLFTYGLFFVLFNIYKIYKNTVFNYSTTTSIAKNGHLLWNFTNYNGYENIILFLFLSFYLTPFFYINNVGLALIIAISLFISLYFYLNEGTFGTMWCWSSNLLLLFFIINILLVKPFYEYNGLC
jgi:hypothetical protein